MLPYVPPLESNSTQILTIWQAEYATLLASRVQEAKAQRSELKKRRASSMRKD
jgi:hypothetical protein